MNETCEQALEFGFRARNIVVRYVMNYEAFPPRFFINAYIRYADYVVTAKRHLPQNLAFGKETCFVLHGHP